MKYVEHFFTLQSIPKVDPILWTEFQYYIFYKHYSRVKDDGTNETWEDCVLRVINGVMSIRKDWYVKNRIRWDENYWQQFAQRMYVALYRQEWVPPGRGLWAMGTDLVYERGSMPLYNCASCEIREFDDLEWIMDLLMNGVGVGFKVPMDVELVLNLRQELPYTHVIPDTREGWSESVRALLAYYEGGPWPLFDYSEIRPKGAPIKSFGGVASGPEPLKLLHERISLFMKNYIDGEINTTQLLTDIANCIGVCVVSGNVRRSAQIALGDPEDPTFMELKNYEKFPYRAEWGWMSNNSLQLSKSEHFSLLGEIAWKNVCGHDVGYLNLLNTPQGRIGKNDCLPDAGTLVNPCGEIILEDHEVCNLAETCPTRCTNVDVWFDACRYACFYCSTVALLPTHRPETNAVVVRNRRIGVSIIDLTGWMQQNGAAVVTYLRQGYHIIREFNRQLAAEAGVPESIRVTTVKPGGTVPRLVGRSSGISHPTFKYIIRRVRVGEQEPMAQFLMSQGVPWEKAVHEPNTLIFEFPLMQGPARPATEVSVWEQAMNIIMIQREWADNAVSNTLYFRPSKELVRIENEKPENLPPGQFWLFKWGQYQVYQMNAQHEEGMLESLLMAIAPLTKSVSLLPHSSKGAFVQMPEEGITQEEYLERLESMPVIDWTKYNGSPEGELFCSGPHCTRRIE